MRAILPLCILLLLCASVGATSQLEFRMTILSFLEPSRWVEGYQDTEVGTNLEFPGAIPAENIALLGDDGRLLQSSWQENLTSATWTGRLWYEEYLPFQYDALFLWTSDVPGITLSATFTDEWGNVFPFSPRNGIQEWWVLPGLATYDFEIRAEAVPEVPPWATLLLGCASLTALRCLRRAGEFFNSQIIWL